jgi:UDP-N-acetylmuramate dehydrogenase
MQLTENKPLKSLNTFAIGANARYFAAFGDVDELKELLVAKGDYPLLILGGGSNILLTRDIEGYVLQNSVKGIREIREDNEYVYVECGAGENWHQFVLHCISRNWGGVENLSLIPGSVGASPMQNIGAYGVEIKDVFHSLEAFELETGKLVQFTNNDCGFGYRDSVFKNSLRDKYVIMKVTFRLRKKPLFNTSYGAIKEELEKMGVRELSVKAISDAVIRIRTSKLPDPALVGNAGSFFKNPTVSRHAFETLQQRFPGVVSYALPGGQFKLAAGWLIEQCGWKGFRRGDAGCHARQALVLVNYGNATGKEIEALGNEIMQSVKDRFDVSLEREVNIV